MYRRKASIRKTTVGLNNLVRVIVEEVLELLADLASKGVKLCVEGDDLGCYAPKGHLTREVRASIAQHKPKIIHRLKDYMDFRAELTSIHLGTNARIGGSGNEGKHVAQKHIPLNLVAEAVLDTDIQPPAGTKEDSGLDAAEAVFLTGGSGFLGAYLLYDLLTTTKARMHCLVRCRSKEDGDQRIKNNLLKYGLWNEDFASRVEPVPGDLALPLLGIETEIYDRLCNTIDIVYHNGAVVNFIYSYASLKDSNVGGTREVIRLACRAKRKPLHFISTIGVFPPATKRDSTVLESDHPGNWQSLIGGYPQTKWVAERLVTIAADRGLPVRIYRPGFVTGDSKSGIWNTDDFLARMIKGCIQLGSAPDLDAGIEMAPVDYVSKAIIHLSRQQTLQSNTFHIVGSRHIPAGDLFRIINSLGYTIKLLPYSDWRKALFDDAKKSTANALFPLLTGFAAGTPWEMPRFDCRHALEQLKGTQILCPDINETLVAAYLGYFKSTGFLDA
jgi:thioester reductase-like protein